MSRRADMPPPIRHRLAMAVFRAILWLAMRLSYDRRVAFGGWLGGAVIGPLAGYRRRIRANLALVCPDLPRAEVERICREVPANLGRVMIELFSGPEFLDRVRRIAPTGPGLAALEAARAAGRPVLVVTGHIGNYDAARAALQAQGFRIAGLYRPMKNRLFNDRYVAAMEVVGGPLFPRGREGMAGMIRHLRGGGMLGILVDQYMRHGVPLRFMGRPALTALSAAELALKYDAEMIPAYGIRRADGVTFDVVVEAPVPRGTPEAMTQALNDSLEAHVRAHMGQWLWSHQRWKGVDADGNPVPVTRPRKRGLRFLSD